MKYRSLTAIILIPILSNAATITEVVQRTIQTHPQMQVKKEILYAKKETLTNVKSGYYPSIDLSYSVGPEKSKTIANGRKDANLLRQNSSATLTQELFSGLSTFNGLKEKRELILSASENVNDTANTLAMEAITAYLNVLKYNTLYKISQDNVILHEKYLQQLKDMVNSGVGISSDYTQTLSRFENVKSDEYLAKLQYINSLHNYQRVLPEKIIISDMENPSINELRFKNVDVLIRDALSDNPLIKSLKTDIKAAKRNFEVSSSTFYPTVDLVIQGYWDSNLNGVSTALDNPVVSAFEENSGYNALLVFNYNIFNGFADTSTKQINKHKLLENFSRLKDNERILTLNMQTAFETFKITKKRLLHIENNIKATATTAKDYQKEHELGRRSIIDLLNISVEHNSAKNRKVNSEFDLMIAYYQILSYSGKLLDEMNITIEY